MKALITLLLIALVVGVFMIVGNTKKDTPESPGFSDWYCQTHGC